MPSEGCLYNIKKIKIVANKDSYRPLSYGFKLIFLQIINPKKLEREVTNTPLDEFEFIRPDRVNVRTYDKYLVFDFVFLGINVRIYLL